jgi:quinol monooxygenase YgiN
VKKLAHMVFFDLKEDTPAAREKLVAGCKKHLSGHDGALYFSVGTIGDEFRRDVNVRDFHVALHVVFKDKSAHDAYQKHARHVKFVEENKDLWKRARVFDSYLSEPPG